MISSVQFSLATAEIRYHIETQTDRQTEA
uniref:Uncharacterized protein n=1 Tax=Rhizophora mucronata TaxID=61149 RepID=A0A2P2N3M9_RHIMU